MRYEMKAVIDTLGFLIHGFGAGRQSTILGVWAAPAAQKTIPKGGGLRPPLLGSVFGSPGAVQIPNIDDFWVPGK